MDRVGAVRAGAILEAWGSPQRPGALPQRGDALHRALCYLPGMLLISLVMGCSGDETPPTAEAPWVEPGTWGPYDAGVTTLEIVDARGKELTVEVWYPAQAIEGDEPDPYPVLPISMDAYRNAPAAAGPFPLVAFTHGHIAIRFQSAFLCEHLASHGFVVVAPDHPGDTLTDLREDELWQIVLERPGDVISSVDAVLQRSAEGDALLGGITDAQTYAIVGHSLGSLNAMVIGGAEPDYAGLVDFCADPANASYEGCDRLVDIDLADVSGHETSDPRAIVTVPMSPGLWYAFGVEGLSTIRAPLLIAGELDEVLPYETEARPVYELMASPKTLATFPRGGHYPFSDICLFLPVWTECGGEADGFVDVERAQQITEGMVTAWIRSELLGDVRAMDWLEAERQAWPEVVWESE